MKLPVFAININTPYGHDQNENNGHNGYNTRVSSFKGGVKGKTVSCIKIKSSKNSSKNSIDSNSQINSANSGYAFKDPCKNQPVMSFSKDSSDQQMQKHGGTGGTAPGASAFNPGGYPISSAQQAFNIPQSQMTGPPSWASELIEDVKQIKLSMTKLDQIERTVNVINMKVSDLEIKVNSIEPRVTEVERSCTFIGRENDDRKKELERTRTEVNRLRTDCANMQNDTYSLRTKNAALEAKVTDLESRLLVNQ